MSGVILLSDWQVTADSVAARCGLRAGDIVVRLCGQPADGMTHLMAQQTIASCTDSLEIIVERFELLKHQNFASYWGSGLGNGVQLMQ